MRALHVVPSYLPAIRYGGPIYSVHGLCKALVARGHEVHVFTTNVDGPDASPVPLETAVDLDGVNVWYFPCGLGRRLYRSPAMAQALGACISRFDILHLHSVFLWPTLAAARAAVRADVPYLLTPRGMLVPDLIRRKSRIAKSLWISLYERKNIERAAAVHVTSEIEKAELEQLGFSPRSIAVIPNGIDLPPAPRAGSWAAAGARPFVLSLGRISWKKGLDRLSRPFAHVPDADLVIAGNDEEGLTPGLQAIARELGLAERVRFLGATYGEAKWELMRRAAVFALASYSENFGNAVLEAMACGIPVVVTPEVGLADEVSAAGAGIVCEGKPQVLGCAIAGLLADAQHRAALGAAGSTT